MSAYENAQDQFPAAAQVEEETKMEEGVARESLASLCEEEVHKTAVKTAVHFGLPTVIPNKKTPKKDLSIGTRNLSKVSRMYDMDGDGQLGKLLIRDISCHVANYLSHTNILILLYYCTADEAEQAMRNLDTSGRGHLTNDKVFELMTEHFDDQRQLFKMKKVLIG